ncbi:hypothetical protein [Mucisphaera sp.]|uniref:hypothetical protein n=1 Tax=Mucisphaera sp. TaxID=2913024 RepID=UPI003D0E5CE9
MHDSYLSAIIPLMIASYFFIVSGLLENYNKTIIVINISLIVSWISIASYTYLAKPTERFKQEDNELLAIPTKLGSDKSKNAPMIAPLIIMAFSGNSTVLIIAWDQILNGGRFPIVTLSALNLFIFLVYILYINKSNSQENL